MKKSRLSIVIILGLIVLISFPVKNFAQDSQIVKEQVEIELRDGKVIRDIIISFENGIFILKEKGRLEAGKVKSVRIVNLAEKQKLVSEKTFIDKDVQAIVASASEAEKKFQNVNGIIILDEGTNILNEDGTTKYRYHFIGKVLTNKAKEWANVGLYFSEERSKANVILARTIASDGKVIELDRSTIQISSPSREAEFFGSGKIMSFTIPAVEIGSLIEYIYEYDNFNPWDKNIYEPSFYFQGEDPVVMSKVTVTIPASKELNYISKNMPANSREPVITKGANSVSYMWKVENVESIVKEPYMPDSADITPQIHGCMLKDREYLYDWASKIILERMKLTPELEEATLKITKNVNTVEEKIARLYYFVQNEIRYISIKGSMSSGWGGHPAYQTFQNKYGDCIDKSILFSTMLKAIGIEAYPVSLRTNDKGTAVTEISVLDANHAIVEIHLKDRVFYLDPVSRNFRYPYFCGMDHGVYAINEITKKINFIEIPSPEFNLNIYNIDIDVKSNGDSFIITKGGYNGDYEANLRSAWERVPENMRLELFQNHINSLSPGGKLKKIDFVNLSDISKPLEVNYEYVLPKYSILAGKLMIFEIPGLEYSFPEIALSDRKYDIEYTTSRETKHIINIKIPAGYKIKYLPKSVNLSCGAYASYDGTYEIKDNNIVFKDDFKRFKRVIAVKDYKQYKEFLQGIAKFSRDKIFLAKEDK